DAVNEAMAVNLINEFPMTLAQQQMGATFKALLEGRWDDARQMFVATSRTFDATQRLRHKALFQLAVGHLAGDRFAEAGEASREAEAFFEERGAGWLVPAYRAKAVRPDERGRSAGSRPGSAASALTSGAGHGLDDAA